MKKNNYKIDPLTGKRFIPARSNQRFASAVNRIIFNNNLATALRNKLKPVNYPLHKNIKILEKLLYRKKELILTKEYLSGIGFNFDLTTKVVQVNGKKYNTIYQYAIIPIKNQIKITRI